MRQHTLLLVALGYLCPIYAQSAYGDQPLAHTYSIVAYDSITGDMGVAVQSHWFSVGTLVIWGEAGVGAIATQSFVNPAFGPDGLALLKKGMSAPETANELVTADEGRDFRQLGVVDNKGNTTAFTGEKCIDTAGHLVGKGYAVQANMMENDRVWSAMAKAFEASAGQPLAERLVAALEAAQKVGGDIRGQQSAALLVVSAENTGKPWVDRKVDLRVEDHATPVAELKRLLKTHRAYEFMNRGDLQMEEGEIEAAMQSYGAASKMFPENLEMKFWTAVNLANTGKIEQSLPMFQAIFKKDKKWAELLKRLPKSGLLTVSEADMKRILK
jgi:uncharacterized Ntn-hydrolase superfamily protein